MKEKIILLGLYLETRFVNLLWFFGIKRDSSEIPVGLYCYTYDNERNEKEPCSDGSFWIKTCKYYKSRGNRDICTYVGFYGHDFALYDQCKICGRNYGLEEELSNEENNNNN
jgi:hypothetical protein